MGKALNQDSFNELQVSSKKRFSIINHYGLTKFEVKEIVRDWYLSIDDILQDESGSDLEELLDY